MVVLSSLGRTVAKVVLPSPGGPSKRMCDNGSFSFLHAFRTMPRRCTTPFWPMISRSKRGRRAASRRLSSSSPPGPWTIASRGMFHHSVPKLRLGTPFREAPASPLRTRPRSGASRGCIPKRSLGTRCSLLLIYRQQDVFDTGKLLAARQNLVEPVARFRGPMANGEQRLVGVFQYIRRDGCRRRRRGAVGRRRRHQGELG